MDAKEQVVSALLLAEVFGVPNPLLMGPCALLRVGETAFDYLDTDGNISPQHDAFLISENEYDQILERIRERRIPCWADPHRNELNNINIWDDARGLCFDEPNGHLLEIITRPYGDGGTLMSKPYSMVAFALDLGDRTNSSDEGGWAQKIRR